MSGGDSSACMNMKKKSAGVFIPFLQLSIYARFVIKYCSFYEHSVNKPVFWTEVDFYFS